MTLKIGILREVKIPSDDRVALTPKHCKYLQEHFDIKVKVQPSEVRAITNEEYSTAGIELNENITDCDVIIGVKEIDKHNIIPNKTYFFFSHTIKKQLYNQQLLQNCLKNNIRLIDYELLKENDVRIIGFGKFAGIVGAHETLRTYFRLLLNKEIPAAFELGTLAELYDYYKTLTLPPFKIVLTGNGNVAKGSLEVLRILNIPELSPEEFQFFQTTDQPVFTQLKNEHLFVNKESGTYDRNEFHKYPERYKSVLSEDWNTDILINGIYWHDKMPRLFEVEDVNNPAFKMEVIGDVTCDIDGSVPITVEATEKMNPFFIYNKETHQKDDINSFDTHKHIAVMSIDNLPTQLPIDASNSFGDIMVNKIIPELLREQSDIIENATICKDGQLTQKYNYLSDYVFETVE